MFFFGVSSIGLGFLNPTLRLKRWDVMSFCMQLENIEDKYQNWGERGCYLGLNKGKWREKKHLSFSVHRVMYRSGFFESDAQAKMLGPDVILYFAFRSIQDQLTSQLV